MSYATVDLLRSQLGSAQTPEQSAAYAEKQLHPVPDAPVVDRATFILDRVKGKRVLEFGASGPMHDAIVKAAGSVVGVDRVNGWGVIAFDLDDVSQVDLPMEKTWPDVIVCGEVLEHLGNPGWFLERLHRFYAGVPVIITVPNAHSASGVKQLTKGIENCNKDHVAWYSYRTLLTLVTRAGFTVQTFAWYNGQPYFAEGLIMVVE